MNHAEGVHPDAHLHRLSGWKPCNCTYCYDDILIAGILFHFSMLPFPVPEMVDSGDEYDRTLFSDEDPGWRRLLFGHLTTDNHDDSRGAMSSDSEETETDDEPVPSWGRHDDYYSQQGVAELASKLPVPLPRSASLSRKSRSAATQQKLDF